MLVASWPTWLADVGRLCPKIGHIRPELGRIRQLRPHSNQTRLGPNLGDFDRSWADLKKNGLHSKILHSPLPATPIEQRSRPSAASHSLGLSPETSNALTLGPLKHGCTNKRWVHAPLARGVSRETNIRNMLSRLPTTGWGAGKKLQRGSTNHIQKLAGAILKWFSRTGRQILSILAKVGPNRVDVDQMCSDSVRCGPKLAKLLPDLAEFDVESIFQVLLRDTRRAPRMHAT